MQKIGYKKKGRTTLWYYYQSSKNAKDWNILRGVPIIYEVRDLQYGTFHFHFMVQRFQQYWFSSKCFTMRIKQTSFRYPNLIGYTNYKFIKIFLIFHGFTFWVPNYLSKFRKKSIFIYKEICSLQKVQYVVYIIETGIKNKNWIVYNQKKIHVLTYIFVI